MAEMTSPTRLPPLAVLAGVRTPFAKAFGALGNVPADQLGRIAVEAGVAAGRSPARGCRRGRLRQCRRSAGRLEHRAGDRPPQRHPAGPRRSHGEPELRLRDGSDLHRVANPRRKAVRT